MSDLHLKANDFPCAFFNVHQSFFNWFGDPQFAMIALHEPNHIRFQTNASQAPWATAAVLRRALPVDLTGCAAFQRRLIYFPPRFRPEQVDQLAQSAKLERWKNTSGQAIGMKRLSPKQPAVGRVLVVYGNGSCATGCAHYADVIQDVSAFDVFILEYPGYADRPGSPSQKSLFRAADEAFQLLATNGPVYLVGESLGTGVAAYLAGTHPDQVAGVILLGAYNRLTDVAQLTCRCCRCICCSLTVSPRKIICATIMVRLECWWQAKTGGAGEIWPPSLR